EAEIGLRVDFGGGAEVADAVPAFECCAAIFADQDGEAGRFVIRERSKDLVNLSREIILGGGRLRGRKDNREQHRGSKAGVIPQQGFSPERSISSHPRFT